jgi:hypothetical protein
MPDRSSNTLGDEPDKDPFAVELGRRGGRKGGRARAESLSSEQRSDIARRAAAARWEKRAGEGVETDDGRKDRAGRLNERLRQAFLAGAEEHSIDALGRSLSADELRRISNRYPGSLDPKRARIG